MIDSAQLLQQRQAMEMQRFGHTRAEIMKIKGEYCHHTLTKGDYHEGKLVISHINGGGRHASENGMIIPGKTHSLDNMTVLCQRHDGMKDRESAIRGMGIAGNPDNPSQ